MRYKPEYPLKTDYIPMISGRDIERDAMIFANEYDSTILEEPHAFDIEGFIQDYLGLDIIYRKIGKDTKLVAEIYFAETDIYLPYEARKKPKNEQVIPLGFKITPVKQDTIVLDSSYLNPKLPEAYSRMALAHACAHWIYHQERGRCGRGVITCFHKKQKCDDYQIDFTESHDWLSYQADLFAHCILMPRKSVFKLMKSETLRSSAWDTLKETGSLDCGNFILKHALSGIYNVPDKAGKNRLFQLKCDLKSEATAKNNDKLLQLIENAEEGM